ncbi:membrane-associated protein, putative [Bodo saltans]|uniref:Membrane-associated protein, putative n=1 Tax=Bodo saltans TaxID=75058 RepID=A0A0S4IZL6_BODSA|nr:membrane-associated protein, putative [Bodo saltans]|eukprot:CUG32563.1 membrane-associated protein, putative [Bodo saltans]
MGLRFAVSHTRGYGPFFALFATCCGVVSVNTTMPAHFVTPHRAIRHPTKEPMREDSVVWELRAKVRLREQLLVL